MPPASRGGSGPAAATASPRPHPSSYGSEVSRVRFRRALALMVMTLVVPGSAQLAAGNRRTGLIALRVGGALLGTGLLLGLLGLASRSLLFWLVTDTVVLGLLRVVLMLVAIGWAYLFVDAWRLGNPLGLRQKQRLAMVGINGVLCFGVAGSLLFASHVVAVQKDFIAAMFGSGAATGAHDGRYNVLLLGGDSGSDRWGMRPDSITVASIDAESGQTVLLGLPRNLTDFPFRSGSTMDKQFPDGYDCGPECELNSLSTWASDHAELFRGVDNPGVEATTQAVEGITGLRINYWAMVNLKGFENFVDAVGGVELTVRDSIPIGGVGAPVSGYIKPGTRTLNGFETLWFARSRESADDYSRMARQKCVMNAMLDQLDPQTVALKFEDITKASTDLLSTDLPASELSRFMDLTLKAKGQPMRTVSFVPPMVNTSDPDIDKIQRAVKQALDPAPKSTSSTSGSSRKAADVPADTGTTGGSIGSLREGYAANQADDLDKVC